MINYKCIIIDDEPHAIEGLIDYLQEIPNLKLVRTYTNPIVALAEILAAEPVDLIFMDINMPKISGLEVARAIRHQTNKLIFTTYHERFAYQAYESEGDAFLLKPFTLIKFVSVISKLFPLQLDEQADSYTEDDSFFIKTNEDFLKYVHLKRRDVIAVESKLNYVQIHTNVKTVMTYMSLTEISKAFLVHKNFIRFQRSFIINKDHIEIIHGNTIQMAGGLKVTVGEHFRKDFVKFLDGKLLKKLSNKS